MSQELIQKAAEKANVPVERIAGPFPGSVRPPNGKGLYLRVSEDTDEVVWAHFDGSAFGLYSDSKARALSRSKKRSKKQLLWFGITKA